MTTQDAEMERRWAEVVAAKQKAEETGDIRDGIAAGQAWGAFMSLFWTPPANVVSMPRRR